MINFDFDMKNNSVMRCEFIEFCAQHGIYATLDERELPTEEPDMPRNIPWDIIHSFMFKNISDCCVNIEMIKKTIKSHTNWTVEELVSSKAEKEIPPNEGGK